MRKLNRPLNFFILFFLFLFLEAQALPIKSTLSLKNYQYATEWVKESQKQNSYWLRAQLYGEKKYRFIDTNYDVEASHMSDDQQASSFLVVSELSTSIRGEDTHWVVGRHLNDWNALDDYWRLGIWQPRFRWDYLQPKSQGFTGFFLNWHLDQLKIVGFVSPLYFPEQGPAIQERSGKIVARNSPWFPSPTNELRVLGKTSEIEYRLLVPETSEIVLQNNYALMGQWGDSDDGFWSRAAYAYKPMNQLLFRFQGFLSIESSPNKGLVQVIPRTEYHHLRSMDMGYTGRKIRSWVSVLSDSPVNDAPQPGWSTQRFYPMIATSMMMGFRMGFFHPEPMDVNFGYLRVYGGGSYDDGSLAVPSESIFGSRVMFRDAVKVSLNGPFVRINQKKLNLAISWIYDFMQRGTLVQNQWRYFPTDRWSFAIGGDFLWVADETSAERGFLQKYRANDRAYGEMTYVF